MKPYEKDNIKLIGQFDKNGQPVMYGLNDLKKFGEKYKGQKFMVQFKLISKKPSEAMIGYFYAVIIPDFIEAMKQAGSRFDKEEAEDFILTTMKTTCDLNKQKIEELDRMELFYLIDEYKQWAVEHLHIYVEDAFTLINK